MQCLLIYDISSDRLRAKIADACLDYGLDRTQYSTYYGDISPNYQEELFLKVSAILGDAAGNVLLVPICASDWRARMVLEQEEGDDDA